MKPDAIERAERVLGLEARTWARVERRGYSMNEHWTAVFDDGTRAFVKTGAIDPSPQWIRDEHAILRALGDVPFAPRLLGYEDGDAPLLVLDDLIDAYWPPSWRDGDVDLVLATLAEVAAVRIDLRGAETILDNGWRTIEADPAPFLSTGLRDAAWLDAHLHDLVAATDAAPAHGDALCHADVRSDNLCIKDGRCILVDWNHASLGNPGLDVAFWAPSLALERGPDPWTLGVDALAPLVAGFFAARAGLPKPAGAPTVRDFQREQARVALDWVEFVAAR
jgi:hypothetical protein